MLHLFQKWSPAGLLVSENLRSPIFPVLVNRDILFFTLHLHTLHYDGELLLCVIDITCLFLLPQDLCED